MFIFKYNEKEIIVLKMIIKFTLLIHLSEKSHFMSMNWTFYKITEKYICIQRVFGLNLHKK
jgi:hypothetical protein